MTRRLSEAELHLWGRIARSTRPLRGRADSSRRAELASPPEGMPDVSPKPTRGKSGKLSVNASAPKPVSPPQDASGHRRIRRGDVAVEARIDLHGYTQDAARRALIDFVVASRADGVRRVLVITGKGRNGRGVLRARFLDWIAEPDIRPFISGYAPAHVRHGGEGAYYLLLKVR